MIGRPPWEAVLRTRLRRKIPRRGPPKDRPVVETIALIAMGAFLIALLGIAADDDAGRGTALTLVTGAFGSIAGTSLRARWYDGNLMLAFAPISPGGMRRIESRGALPTLLRLFGTGLAMAALGAVPGGPLFILQAVPAAACAMLIGAMLASGRWGKVILWASFLSGLAWSFLLILENDLTGGTMRSGFLRAWIPALPWSLWVGDYSDLLPRLAAFAACLALCFREWRKAWVLSEQQLQLLHKAEALPHDVPAVAEEKAEVPAPAADHGTLLQEAGAEEDRRPVLRSDLRATVSKGWVGMAGYVNPAWLSRLDWLAWRSMVPRQRLLWCLGLYGARRWMQNTLIGAGLLAAAVLLVWTMRLSAENKLGPVMNNYALLMIFPALIAAVIAASKCWPGHLSGFAPWLQLFRPGFRAIPMIAIFPVSPRQWVGCAIREWVVRGAWTAVIWSLAALAVGAIFAVEPLGFRYLFGWFMVPWLWLAAMMPLSIGGRLLRACSGPLRGTHASSMVFVALLFFGLCAVATFATILAFWQRYLPVFAGGIAVAAIAGWAGLQLALTVAGNMRLDAAPPQGTK